MKNKNVLIVGAGGFAGGFHVEEAIKRGYNVWAGVRASTSRKYLTDENINFVELDFDNPSSLGDALGNAIGENERWHYIVYNLGATKCLNFADFSRINYQYLRSFTESLKEADLVPEKFLFISSLSALGPGDESGYSPFTEKTIPNPNTRYGASKLKAEMWLATAGIPYIVFRATGIYGPRDKDYFLMFKSIAKGFDFSVGYKRQMLSFIYISDLSSAIFDALEKAPVNETYNIAEPHCYSQKEFRKIAAEEIGKRIVIPLAMPLWAVKAVSALAEKLGVVMMKPTTLNSDKYNILKQRNWNVDVSKARRDFGFKTKVNLKLGIHKAIEWYKQQHWL